MCYSASHVVIPETGWNLKWREKMHNCMQKQKQTNIMIKNMIFNTNNINTYIYKLAGKLTFQWDLYFLMAVITALPTLSSLYACI